MFIILKIYELIRLNILLFIFHLLRMFEIIPVIGWVIFVMNLVIPLVILFMIWGSYVNTISGISQCFGGVPTEVPGTGGIRIGT